ncbi:MAG: hypothetical protein CL910_19715 [Deltaproteobacteria bacterium]|jgi:hypothetical protein|nr:hypothetical protein [Deltaproteobacteria bacterium]
MWAGPGTRLAFLAAMVVTLAFLVLLVSAADHWTTYLCLRAPVAGWQVAEANPISAWLFEVIGLSPGLWLDSVATLIGMIFLIRTPLVPEEVKVLFLAVVVGTTAYAVDNNLDALFKLGLSPLGGGS